jgi:hypothetical protein
VIESEAASPTGRGTAVFVGLANAAETPSVADIAPPRSALVDPVGCTTPTAVHEPELAAQNPRSAARTAVTTSSFPLKSTRTASRPNANSSSSCGSPVTVTGDPLPTVATV